MKESRSGLPDGCGFRLGSADIFAALGAIGITIAVTEYHPPWPSAWFIAGAVLCALGSVAAIWALVLYLAHKEAENAGARTRALTLQRLNSEDLPLALSEPRRQGQADPESGGCRQPRGAGPLATSRPTGDQR